jgi:hypothetical protein
MLADPPVNWHVVLSTKHRKATGKMIRKWVFDIDDPANSHDIKAS